MMILKHVPKIKPNLTVFWSILFVICGCGNCQEAASSKSFPITTLINAKWEQTPLHLEIAEFLADENANLYWDFLKDITDLDITLSSYDTPSQTYNAAINVVRRRLTDLQMPLMKLIVSMHSLTPRIQTHFQIASEVLGQGSCPTSATFAQIGTELTCSVEELRKALNSGRQDSLDAAIEVYAFDHIYPGTENNSRTVVLYGDIGSKTFAHSSGNDLIVTWCIMLFGKS